MYSGNGSISQEWQPLAKFAGEVLQSLTEGVLDDVLSSSKTQHPAHKQETDQGTSQQLVDDHQMSYSQKFKKQKQEDDDKETSIDSCEVPNMYQLVLENPRVPQEALEGFFSAQLVQMLTHRPNIKLTRVLKEQGAWCFAKANPMLVSLMQKLVVGLGHEEALNVLELVLSNEEVNWGCVLTLVATALTCHRATAARLKELIEKNIRRGCEELENESMVVGFLFARHAGQEGRHLFPPYAQWFSSLFGSETASPAGQKQSFTFLMRFLTDMVPHEPAYCLRAHLNSHVFTPKGCHEILRSYTHLARARLQELKETMQDNVQVQSSKTKVVEEVDAAVKQFAETGKVPSFVLKDSMFRENYFKLSFIPALLTPRHLPEVPDARAKLIDALHARGKISQILLRNYSEACQKEAADLLQGVFMDLEEEDELVEEPITELTHLLGELVVAHHKRPNGDSNVAASEVLPVLSKVSLKIEEMMKGFDVQLKNAKHLVFDRRLYDEKLLSIQVAYHIINTVGRLLHPPATEESEREEERPGCLTQLLSLLSASVTLQRSLLLLLFHHLFHENITLEQLTTDGIVLFELSKIEGLFLPVVEATHPNQTPTPLTAYYLHHLPLDTPAALHTVCCILSSWLDWHLRHEDSETSLPTEPLHLYLCLAPRLPLLLNHSEDTEVTAADVYNYMEGSSVPDCSRLFFSDYLKGQNFKIPLETWVEFEMRAAWGDVPMDVRQTFLHSRLLGNVSLSQNIIVPPEPHTPALDKLVAALVSSFAVLGMKQRNSSDLLLLLQNAGQQCKNIGFCLLEAWHMCFKGGKMESRSTLSYISICRCLSPSLFLRADKLLELAEIMQAFVNVLMSVTDTIQLSLCDTTFLCASLFAAAAEPNVKNLHVELCLKAIKSAIVFHWDSLRNFFWSHIATVNKHRCLELMCITLSQESSDLLLLGPEDAGVRLLSITLSLNAATCNKSKDIITAFCGKTSYLKWLLAYLGLRQLKGNIPYLPVEREKCNIMEVDERVMMWSYKELMKLLVSKTITEVTGDIFPRDEEIYLGFRLVPIACIFVVISVREGHLNTDMDVNLCETDFMEILLQCSNLICQTFDNQNSDDRQPDNNSSRKSLLSSKRWIPDLDYLSYLHKKLILYLSASSPSVLAKITKNTVMKCDSEVRATIYNKVAGKRT